MDIQDKIKIWVKAQLMAMPRGAKKKFADYLEITPTQATRLLNTEPGKERRSIRADELVKITEFFGKLPDDLASPVHVDNGKQQLITLFDSVSPELQRAILAMVQSLAQNKERK